MKKFLILVFMFVMTIMPIFASVKDSLFVVKNATPADTAKVLYTNFSQLYTGKLVFDEENCIVFTKNGNIYLRAYQNDSNTELYVVANDLENTTKTIKNISYKVFVVKDKVSLKKYKSDYLSYANENKFGNAKVSKKQNSHGYRDYDPYMGGFRNKIIEKQVIVQDDINIKRTQLKPKVKVKHYANEYVYEITNNTGKDIVINKVASEGIIGLTQIAAYCVIPRGIDFIPIWGIVYGVQTDLEKNKFTRPHPVDETIKKGETMRVLALSKKDDNPVIDFYFTINNKKVKFVYDPLKGEKL